MDGSGEVQMMARWLGEVQVRSNLKRILSLTLVDVKLVIVKVIQKYFAKKCQQRLDFKYFIARLYP